MVQINNLALYLYTKFQYILVQEFVLGIFSSQMSNSELCPTTYHLLPSYLRK
jgi:hypothetical protein